MVLLDLSILEGFYETPGDPSTSIAHFKAPYIMKDKVQEYIRLAHSVTEISNAIQAQMQCVEVVDLTLDDTAGPENESTEE
jgi:hypothetical protein